MIRPLRHKLSQIRRYSASKSQTVWSRAHDRAFIASFLLAWIAVWVADATVSRISIVESASGRLLPGSDGSIQGIVLDESTLTHAWMGVIPIGTFEVSATEAKRGWPFISSRRLMALQTDLDIFAEPGPRPRARIAPDDPIGIAIESALAESPNSRALVAWSWTSSEHQINWRGFLGGGLLWWVILAAAFGSAIHATRFAAHFMGKRRAQREASRHQQGCCTRCGYDLRGLEFNERCPECGTLAQ
jgi:hypothetical protein